MRRGGRQLALEVLESVEARGSYANLALGPALERSGLPAVERGLATELVYGVVRRRLTLDWVIQQFLTRPLDTVAPWLRNLLRLSFYQMLFLERVPVEAVCYEAVELAKTRGHRGTAGLVNAVLRAYLRRREQVVWPDPEKEPVKYLSVRESHPEWLVERWLERLGFPETAALLAADNLPPPVTLRVNRRRATPEEVAARLRADGLATRPSRLAPEGLVLLSPPGSVRTLPVVAGGLAQVQGEASMLVAHLVGPAPGDAVLDAASAPGGKATHLAELMGDEGCVTALDVHREKLRLVEENARRLGLRSIRTEQRDAQTVGADAGWVEAFDRVLLDAPCSGLGVLRGRADARWRKRPEDIGALAAQQRLLIRSVASAVRKGGRLVYATCSTEPEEGEEVVEWFLGVAGGSFAARDARQVLGERGVPAAQESSAFNGPYLRLWPHLHGTDGFFAACLERR